MGALCEPTWLIVGFGGGEAHRLPFFVDWMATDAARPTRIPSRSGFDLVDAFYEYTLEPAASTESRFCDRFTTAP